MNKPQPRCEHTPQTPPKRPTPIPDHPSVFSHQVHFPHTVYKTERPIRSPDLLDMAVDTNEFVAAFSLTRPLVAMEHAGKRILGIEILLA